MKVNRKPMMLHGIAELTQGREREREREGETQRGRERERGRHGGQGGRETQRSQWSVNQPAFCPHCPLI